MAFPQNHDGGDFANFNKKIFFLGMPFPRGSRQERERWCGVKVAGCRNLSEAHRTPPLLLLTAVTSRTEPVILLQFTRFKQTKG